MCGPGLSGSAMLFRDPPSEAVSGIDEPGVDRWTREAGDFLNRMGASPRARWAFDAWFRTRRKKATDSEGTLPAGVETRRLRRGGQSVACYSWGRGPAVLLVHGLHGSASQLSHFVTPLTRAGYRAVAFDAPAHGASEGESTDILGVEQAMLGVREAFGEVYGVVAFSLGCTWSLWALSRDLAAERVVCIAPLARQSFLYETFVRRHRLSATLAREFEALHHERYGPFEDYDTIRLCRSLEVPALIYHDSEDAMIPPNEGGAQLSEAWKGSRFVATRGLGHFRMIRDPALIDGVARFLSEAS